VITVSGHHTKSGWDKLALRLLKEQLVYLGVTLNEEKTQLVDILKGEPFSYLGFDFRRLVNRQRTGHFILLTPNRKARKAMKAKIHEIINNGGAAPAKEIIERINLSLAGWVNYFRVGNSSRAFSEVRDYLEMKVRTMLTRRKW
jgi:RNA-directed DNA polymerase